MESLLSIGENLGKILLKRENALIWVVGVVYGVAIFVDHWVLGKLEVQRENFHWVWESLDQISVDQIM